MGTIKEPVSMLVVEDDQLTREMLGVMIARRFPEIRISFAEDGRSGLEAYAEQTPEIVLTDINMPGMDGIEMAGKIKGINEGVKFIVVTAYGTALYYERFSSIGFSDFLPKPIEFNLLFAAIEKCLAELSRNQDPLL